MLKIYDDKSKILRERCEPVSLPLSKDDEKTLWSMLDYLKKSQDEKYAEKHHIRSGVGLAAPQIGLKKRMYVIYYTKAGKNGKEEVVSYALVNPKIVSNSAKLCALRGGEGCLSVKEDKEGYVYRYYKIVLKAFDLVQNKDITITAYGYDAIVLQHELDHLEGILYYDRINKQNPLEIKPNSELI